MMAAIVEKSVVCPLLVGRTPHFEAFDRLVTQVQAGQGQVVLFSGEAGIGKSRLVAEMSSRLDRSQWLFLKGNCYESDRAFPYASLLDLLRGHFAGLTPTRMVDEVGAAANLFAKLLPEFAGQLATPAPASRSEPEQEKRLIIEGVAHFFQRLASQRPLLLLFEDLHWGDDATLEFLLYLVRHIAKYPILLVLTYRSDETPPNLSHFLSTLDRQRLTTEFVLPRLTIRQMDSMLRIIFGQRHRVRSEFLDAIYSLTEGNPFFIEEILKSLLVTGDIFYTETGWERKPLAELQIPRSVRDAVQRRTMDLSERAREVLSIAAVIGQRFDFVVIQSLTHYSEYELLQIIKELIRAQLLVEASANEFAFRHALTRQAIYVQLLTRERQALHRAIGEVSERVYADMPQMHWVELAYHFDEGGVWEKALLYAQRAGELAQSLYAPRTAVEQFTRAEAAARHLVQAPPAQLYRGRGQAYETLGDFENARDDYEAALASARSRGDSSAQWQALIDLGFLWASRDYARTGEYYLQALELARQSSEPAMLGHSLNRVGNWRVNVGEPQESLRYHREALDIFEELADQHGIAQTLDHLGMAAAQCGDAQGLEYFERAVALFRTLDDRYGLIMSLAMLGQLLTPFQDTDGIEDPGVRGERELKSALALAQEIGWRAGEAYVLLLMGLAREVHGDFATALILTRQGNEVAEEIEHKQWMILGKIAVGSIYFSMLALLPARQFLEQAMAQAQSMGSLIWIPTTTATLAAIYIAQGELELAEAILIPIVTGDTPQSRAHCACWSARALLIFKQGNLEMARQLSSQLAVSYLDTLTWLEWPTLHPQQLLGETLAALGRGDAAEAALFALRDEAISQNFVPRLWPVQISLGKLYLEQKKLEKAEEEFASARRLVERSAATIPDEALRGHFLTNALSMIPIMPLPTIRRVELQKFGGLTERERMVTQLIAQGKSNPEIAEVLVLSKRTVETHISNIMSKLGFDRRAQIIAWAVEKGINEKDG